MIDGPSPEFRVATTPLSVDEIAAMLRDGPVKDALLAAELETTPSGKLSPEATQSILRQIEQYDGGPRNVTVDG